MKSLLILIAGLVLLIVIGSAEANWTTLDYPGAESTSAKGIDGDNIVGSYSTSGSSHGFLYDGTNWTTLDFPGAQDTSVCGIDGNRFCGGYFEGHPSIGPSFIYDGANWITVYPPDTGEYSNATDIDGDKAVFYVGYPHLSIGVGYLYDGMAWTQLKGPAFGIDGDNIVGCYGGFGDYHGFLDDGSVVTTLDFPGASNTYAYDIDGDNIVGSYDGHGFLYDGTTWTTIDFPGAKLTKAFGIDGNKIVGYYEDANDIRHGFIYTIPAPPIETEVDIDPDTLNLNSKGKWITCYIWLPEEYDVADVNSQSVFLEDVIGADWVWADEQEQVMMAKFKRSDIQEMLTQSGELGEIELTVRCELMDGTPFEGMDIIRVIDKGKK